ncbi:UreD urease accessory protein-domain-containing protein [Aspergillus pseudoustus]|uniref:UreD urease accessory protein-domain-containing protein n=1 Tax=Aspergillus pseudoustus TaxID=1810923 RepID=A0ABR4JEW4_9EURO
MPIKSPFESSIAKAGAGKVVLSLLPPAIPSLSTLTYKYPLKLLTRSPGFVPQSAFTSASQPVHLYLLTYGGGLLPGDQIDVSISLEPQTRLVVTTPQGSTKIFKTETSPGRTLSDQSRQVLDVRIGKEAALCYLPDPSAPFRDSRYEQIQTFTIDSTAKGSARSSLCVLDWVTQGRISRGENWDFQVWKGKNEIWMADEPTVSNNTQKLKRKLILRDALILNDETVGSHAEPRDPTNPPKSLIRERTSPHGVIGTLILYGPVFESLSSFFVDRFTSLPRIGARNWSSSAPAASESTPHYDSKVTFTAAQVRAGCVLVKFGAEDFETAKDWLGAVLREEGSIAREFGEEALLCL